jgi:2,4-dienoyl-CoA reductase-like NADH-dependent reductase (Old Yellow Enzyme family)
MENKSNSSSQKILITPIKMGAYELGNRIAMAPLTRCRADDINGIPNNLQIKYYTERACEAGFILTECSAISRLSNSFSRSCGIYSSEQIKGWKKVCNSVHEVNGKIFLQIWHCGRSALTEALDTNLPVGPSPIRNRHPGRSATGFADYDCPMELSEDQILELVELFRNGARNALEAGFDGVELHGGNGYLIDNFLRDAVNKRTDRFGGSIENRCRFPLIVIDALISVFGADKVGMKITPNGRFNDMFDSDPISLFKYLLSELQKRKIAFVEIARMDHRPVPNFYDVKPEEQIADVYETFRGSFDGVIIGNCGFTFAEAEKYIIDNKFDMISFGRLFIANPDLVSRYANDWELNVPNEKTFYTPGKEGYIDYPHF